MSTLDDQYKKLSRTVRDGAVDLERLDGVLAEIDDINAMDEEGGETLLSEFLSYNDFYESGLDLPEVVRRFISHGYDVTAHEGRNGEYAMNSLLYSSYDAHVLEAAKILLRAGISIEKPTDDGDEDGEGIWKALSWKLPGAWSVDQDYTWANILEAYYEILIACAKGQDYHTIDSFQACIGETLTGASVEGEYGLRTDPVTEFSGHLVLWFGARPLVIRPYIDFTVNPVFIEENRDHLRDVSGDLSPILGQVLKEILFVDSSTCSFEFSNGYRMIMTQSHVPGGSTTGVFEIRPIQEPELAPLYGASLWCTGERTYAKSVRGYEEESLVALCNDIAYVIFSYPNGSFLPHSFRFLACSKNLFRSLTRKIPLSHPDDITCFWQEDRLFALRWKFGRAYLYMRTTQSSEFEFIMCDEEFDPGTVLSLCCKGGQHISFQNE